MSQNTMAGGNRATIITIFALTGNHQHQTATQRLRPKDKGDQFRMRLCHGHTMQIDPRLGLQLPALHLTE
jgi:hypothetical protein